LERDGGIAKNKSAIQAGQLDAFIRMKSVKTLVNSNNAGYKQCFL
jgi:hypothetical protein